MSDNSPQVKKPKNTKGAGISFALLAGVLGLAVGAGLYAFSGGEDKSKTVVIANADENTETACTIGNKLRQRLKNVSTGQMAGFNLLDRPYSAANFKFQDKDGLPKTLADWQGRTVLLNLWATWCPPCRAEMPSLDALQKELGGENFEVVAISIDKGSSDKPKKFFQKIKVADLGFYHDPTMKTLLGLKKDGLAYGLPATLLINDQGCVLGLLNGPAEWDSEDAKGLIHTAL
ncbi:MAG: TlpA disulfide reductase family protein [Rhizobiaceae bacterium]